MKDIFILVVKIHLILSFSLIITLFLVGIKKLGFKKIFQDAKSDIYFWFILFEFVICPYRVVLIAFAEACKKYVKACDKIKKFTTKSEGEDVQHS